MASGLKYRSGRKAKTMAVYVPKDLAEC
jgi:hypothetical protein